MENNKALKEVRLALARIAWIPLISPAVQAVVTGVIILTFSMPFLHFNRTLANSPIPVSVLVVVAALLILGLILGTIHENRLLNRYRELINDRLVTSDVLERLALGWDQLHQIYDYTPVPWRLILGHRPKDLPGTARLLAGNLDWYLEEPRQRRGLFWPFLLVAIALVLLLIEQLYLKLYFVPLNKQTLLPVQLAVPVLMSLSVINMWISLHHTRKTRIGAEALLEELRKRSR